MQNENLITNLHTCASKLRHAELKMFIKDEMLLNNLSDALA